jgi:hypothetical protein
MKATCKRSKISIKDKKLETQNNITKICKLGQGINKKIYKQKRQI